MVRFYLDGKVDKAGERFIFYDCGVFGFRIRKSTLFKIHPKFFKNYRVKEGHPDALYINTKLDTLVTRSRTVKMQFLSDMIKPSKDQFIEQVFNLETSSKNIDLQAKFNEFINNKSKRFTDQTRIVYQNAWNSLQAFRPILTKLDSKVLNEYSEYLLDKNYSPNYINKNVNNLIRFCEWLEIPIKIKNPVKRSQSDAIALTLEEVNKIIKKKMPSDKLDQIKDMFIFSCFTGMRYSDLLKFNPDLIKDIKGVGVIVQYDQKEKNKGVVPILAPVRKILDKYSGRIPKINVLDYRKGLKEVCAIAGLNDMVSLSLPKGSTKKVVTMPKYQAISSHSARRVFCTIMIENFGHSPHEVGLMTGQKTEAIIEIYNKSNPERNAVKVFENLKGRV